ncbi:MAG: hypothetical protein Q9199_001891 [Rusavskia elegans]
MKIPPCQPTPHGSEGASSQALLLVDLQLQANLHQHKKRDGEYTKLQRSVLKQIERAYRPACNVFQETKRKSLLKANQHGMGSGLQVRTNEDPAPPTDAA